MDFLHIKINEKFKSSGYHVKKCDEMGLFEFGNMEIVLSFNLRMGGSDRDGIGI